MKYNAFPLLLASTFLSTSAVAITLEPTLDDSAISYSESTSADYNFIVKEYDSKGNSVTKYYKINIDKDRLSDSSNIVWAELDGKPSVMDDVIEIKLPKNKSKYFRYTYNYNGPDYINNNITTPSLLTGSIYTIKGGAIDDIINDNTDIYSDFVNNSVSHSSAHANGGAIYEGNSGTNINIAGNFIGNHAEGIWKSYSSIRNAVGGGAIYKGNYGTWDSIIGNFVGNYVIATSDASSGSWVNSSHQGVGGAIYNWLGNIENITGDFVGNYVIATGPAQGGGGAIYNNYSASIGNITGDFIGNFVESENTAFGGAIYTGSEAGISRINNITGDFIGNYIKSTTLSKGGAISLDITSYDKNEKTKIIGNFIDNYAKTSNGIALGGAIYTKTNLSITSDNQTYIYTGNYTQDSRGIINNAIFVDNAQGNGRISIDFKILNNGYIVFNDEIDGGYFNNNTIVQNGYSYNINISGDVCPSCDVNTIRFNDLVNNVYDLSIIKTQMALGKSAVINVVNDYIAQSNPYLRLDLDAVNKKVGQLNIGGNIEGTTSVIVNVLKDKETTEENSIVFATAKNHNLSEEEAQKSFEVYRVVGSPYMWAISYNDINKTWGLYSTNKENTYTEDCPEFSQDAFWAPNIPMPEVFDGFKPTLDRIKEGIQVVDYISDVEALPNSAFAYQEATSGDNSFSFTDTNAYGTETDKAYKIVLKPEEFSTSSDLTFTADNNGSIEVQLPNGETQYFSYEYIGDSDSNFIGNYFEDSGFANGGAISNWTEGDITADFVENYVSSDDTAAGGAIYNNDNTIADITGDFVGNYAESINGAVGGAIMNGWDNENSIIGNITGGFVGNYTNGEQVANSGAIANAGTIGNINGDFIGNYAESKNGEAWGGAIDNYGSIGNITGDFIGNYVYGYIAHSGAIANAGIIGNITGDFIGNYAESENADAYNGAIMNYGVIDDITGDFIGNHVKGIGFSEGGAIINYGVIDDITGDFIGNYVEGTVGAVGGAISNWGDIGTINGSFINNYVKVTGEDGIGFGGAIATATDLTFKTEGTNNRFSGNYIENADGSKINNAIFVYNDYENGAVSLNFEVGKNGSITFDDEIDGGYNDYPTIIRDGYGYNVNIYGDVCPQCIVNSVIFNSKVKNVYDLTLDTTQMVLGKNAHIQIVNDYIAQNNPYLRLNVDAVNGKTGQLEIGGQVIGTTQVIANIINYKDVRGEESIVFATAPNDTTGGEDSFKIFRVVGSPFMWEVDYDEIAKTWGLAMNDNLNDYEEDCYPETEPEPEPNPEPTPQPLGPIEVAPEIIGFEALQSAGLAQTNGMVYNIMRKVGVNRLFCPGCGFYDYNWDGEPFHNVWVDTTYNGLTIEAPVEIEAKVWGIEAGSDIQHDLNNKLGIFASYRQGNYEMDGKGEKYYSTIGSEIDIDSYLAGLYYRYDYNNWYAFATVYGGMQEAEIKTDDGVSADTDGIEFGGSVEGGYNYALTRTLSVTPSLGVFYSQINYDDATDSAGKTVEYNDLKQVELEAGAKFAYTQYTDDGFYSLYIKPSVVQTLVDGDEIDVTELGKVDTVEDKTLGRIEIGGNYGFNDNWSAYGWANYTFGSSYDATSLGAGVNYAW